MDTFVAKEDRIKINILRFTNTTGEKKRLKILYYIKPVLGEDEIYSNGYINANLQNNVITAQNLYTNNFKGNIAYFRKY